MDQQLFHQTTLDSFSGARSFPQIVMALAQAGLESYTVDMVRRTKTFYMPDGRTYEEGFEFQGPPVAADFSQEQVLAAIRASQAGQSTYSQFLERILKAGTTAYSVFIHGRKAIYFGRKGEFHVENFPQ